MHAILVTLLVLVATSSEAYIKGFNVTCHWKKLNPHMKVYWINLQSNTARRAFMEKQLDEVGLLHERIEAITPSSISYNITKLVKPCKRNTPKDIAVIMSHLTAIRTAIYDPTMIDSEYALITEDDIGFKFDIDFTKLVDTAPKNFSILQLVTSNVEAIHKLWDTYHDDSKALWTPSYWDTMTKDKRTVLFWSTQAYLIHKQRIRPFIDDVVDTWQGKN